MPAVSSAPFGQTPSNIFGNTVASNISKPNTGTVPLGQTTATPFQQPKLGGFGGFGAPSQQSQPFSFGNTLGGTSSAQPTLQASLDKDPYGKNTLLMKSTTVGPSVIPQTTSALASTPTANEKKPVVTPSYKVAPRSVAKIKLRGAAPVHAGPSLSDTPNKSGANLTFSTSVSGSTHVRDGSPKDIFSLGLDSRFTPRRSVKRLVINEQHTPSVQLSSKKDSNVVITAESGLEDTAIQNLTPCKPFDASLKGKSSAGVQKVISEAPLSSLTIGSPVRQLPQGYDMKPSLEDLLLMSDEGLKKVENFEISMKDIGNIQFKNPVDLLYDLKDRRHLKDIVGKIIVFERKCVIGYPDEHKKPPVGFGLNVPAVITLHDCWPLDPETREPIKDADDHKFQRFIKKLQNKKGQKFLGFNINSGVWKFEIEHFRYFKTLISCRYGLFEDYVMEPCIDELMLLSDAELQAVENFKVSLPGVGSVSFNKPVNLIYGKNDRTDLENIVGDIVVIDSKGITVYPDESCKPDFGQGLNVPATIDIFNAWPAGKASPLSEGRLVKHIEKLQKVKDTNFVGFNVNNGCWRFKVEHFR